MVEARPAGSGGDVAFFDKGGVDAVENCEDKNRWPDYEGFFSAAASSTSEKVGAEKVESLGARR